MLCHFLNRCGAAKTSVSSSAMTSRDASPSVQAPSRCEIDNEIEFRRLLDGNMRGVGPVQNLAEARQALHPVPPNSSVRIAAGEPHEALRFHTARVISGH